MQLGSLYQSSGRYDEALLKLNEALKADPQNVQAQMLVGIVYERKGDFPKAQQTLEKVLTQNPRFALAANNLAMLYRSTAATRKRRSSSPRRPRKLLPTIHTSPTPWGGSSISAASTSERSAC